MRITQRQVEAFRAVMLAGSMTAAAELLFVSQPAVTRLIRDFEAETGLTLFERRGTHLQPTRAAVALAEEVERSFVGLGSIAAFADGLKHATLGTLRIAAIPTLADGLLARFLVDFMKTRPGVRVSLASMTSDLVIEAVAGGGVDLGYAGATISRSGFVVHPTPLAAVAVLPTGHRLAERDCIRPGDLVNETFVSLRPGSLFAALVDVALDGIPRTVAFTARTSHAVCSMVAAGAGIALVDPMAAYEQAGRSLVVRPFEPSIEAGFQALRRSDGAAIVPGPARRKRPRSLMEALVEGFHCYVMGLELQVPTAAQRRHSRGSGRCSEVTQT
ncbi:LysR substrate-binding domain-containing protein [Inquilinus limosus]|nr:LysR substrate-binding domain-containing protein [Inquilinus limosus]